MKSEQFGNGTTLESSKIRTFGFQMFTVYNLKIEKFDLNIKKWLKSIEKVRINWKRWLNWTFLVDFHHFWSFLSKRIKFLFFSINFEQFNWIRTHFNQFCRSDLDSNKNFAPGWFNHLSLLNTLTRWLCNKVNFTWKIHANKLSSRH